MVLISVVEGLGCIPTLGYTLRKNLQLQIHIQYLKYQVMQVPFIQPMLGWQWNNSNSMAWWWNQSACRENNIWCWCRRNTSKLDDISLIIFYCIDFVILNTFYTNMLHQVVGVPKIPEILKNFEKKMYTITLMLTEENLKQGSNVYNASNISKPLEISDTHSPSLKDSAVKETVISNVSNTYYFQSNYIN